MAGNPATMEEVNFVCEAMSQSHRSDTPRMSSAQLRSDHPSIQPRVTDHVRDG